MNFEEAIKVIDEQVFAKTGRHLARLEKLVIKAAWEDKEYEEIAKEIVDLPCSVVHLRSNVGRTLWNLLTGVLGSGEKVTKKRLRGIVEQRTSAIGSHSWSNVSDENQQELPVLGGQPPDLSNFYGRERELAILREQVVANRCLVIYGAAGIGKSALAAKLIEDFRTTSQVRFDCFIWKSVHYGPLLQSLLTDLLKLLVVSAAPEQKLPESTQDKTSLLIEFLQSRRCLLVLDAAEVWLKINRNNSFSLYGDQYAEYGVFLRRIVEEKHQSTIVLTSREPFKDLTKLQRSRRPSCSLKIEGLDLKTAYEILRFLGVDDEHRWEDLLEPYLGNPAAIELVASRVKDFFGGSAAKFLNYKSTLTSEIFRDTLAEHFCQSGRLTRLEKQIMLYLAEKMVDPPDAIAFTQFVSDMKAESTDATSLSGLIAALEALHERSLIEVNKDRETGEVFFKLQPVVKRYILKNQAELFGASI